MVQKVAGRLENVHCQPSSTFFESGKEKAAKGEGWATLSSAVPNIHPTATTAIRLWETFTFLYRKFGCLTMFI